MPFSVGSLKTAWSGHRFASCAAFCGDIDALRDVAISVRLAHTLASMLAATSTPKLCVGIDFSGNHRMWSPGCGKSNVWIAEVRCSSPRPILLSLKRVQHLSGDGHPFDRLIRYLRETDFDAAAIDAPFSVPVEYLQPRTHSELLKLVGKAELIDRRPFPSGQDFVDLVLEGRAPATKKPLRRTEGYWRDLKVNVRSTLWAGSRGGAPMTAACLKLLYEAGRPIWPWRRSGRGLIAEAFPAAQLCNWGLTHQRYGREADVETRRSITAAISDRIDLGDFRPPVEQCGDALDAVICAFSAIAVQSGDVLSYTSEHIEAEGSIAVYSGEPPSQKTLSKGLS